MPEGRVVNNSGTLAQEFIITDQQGNARLSFQKVAGAAKIIQENSYYATGLIMANLLCIVCHKRRLNVCDFGRLCL